MADGLADKGSKKRPGNAEHGGQDESGWIVRARRKQSGDDSGNKANDDDPDNAAHDCRPFLKKSPKLLLGPCDVIRNQSRPDNSLSSGSRPSGVRWLITSGRYWLRPLSNSSDDIPLCEASELIWSAPSALARSPGAIALFGPLPTQELAASPWPLCCNCLSTSPSPPEITLPAAPPASRPPNPPFRTSPRPPLIALPPADDGAGAGAPPGWPLVRCLTALSASR